MLSPSDALPYPAPESPKQSVYSGYGSGRASNHSRVLIIGAGASGIAAASRLMENGFYDLTILEAENRYGGRINTVRFAENIVELGAEWVHGEAGNVVYEMAHPLDLLEHSVPFYTSNLHFVWSGGALADNNDILFMANISDGLDPSVEQAGNYTGSFGEWFLDQFQQQLRAADRRPSPDLVDRFLNWYEKATGFMDGSDTWFNTSAKGLTVYRECPGDIGLMWKRNGYRSVFDLLMKRVPNPSQELPVRQRIKLQSEVTAIRWLDRVYGSYEARAGAGAAQAAAAAAAAAASQTPPPRQAAPAPAGPEEDANLPAAGGEDENDADAVEVGVGTEGPGDAGTTETATAGSGDYGVEASGDANTNTNFVNGELGSGDDAAEFMTSTVAPAEEEDASEAPGEDSHPRSERASGTPRSPVVVELSNGARYTADMVLVTVSLGVLKHSANTLFDPPLYQRKQNAIQNLGFGQVNKLFMYFSEPWWPNNMVGYSALVTEEDLEEFKRKYPQYGAKGHWVHGLSGFYVDRHKPNVVLMDWIVGEPARNMEQYSDYQVMMGCKLWLDMYLGQNYSLPLPIGFTRSKWWSNPHFRGSYSYRSLDSDRADAWAAHLAEPILDDEGQPAVMFAGEATHDYYYSTVHGAVETGWREADRILRALGIQSQMENRSRAPKSQEGVR